MFSKKSLRSCALDECIIPPFFVRSIQEERQERHRIKKQIKEFEDAEARGERRSRFEPPEAMQTLLAMKAAGKTGLDINIYLLEIDFKA